MANLVKRSTSNHFSPKPSDTGIPQIPPEVIISPTKLPPSPSAKRSKESRNITNTIRNAAKAEYYLMEVEKAYGFAKAWSLRERLERGQVSLAELKCR